VLTIEGTYKRWETCWFLEILLNQHKPHLLQNCRVLGRASPSPVTLAEILKDLNCFTPSELDRSKKQIHKELLLFSVVVALWGLKKKVLIG